MMRTAFGHQINHTLAISKPSFNCEFPVCELQMLTYDQTFGPRRANQPYSSGHVKDLDTSNKNITYEVGKLEAEDKYS